VWTRILSPLGLSLAALTLAAGLVGSTFSAFSASTANAGSSFATATSFGVADLAAGYNDVYVAGSQTRVVELDWAPAPGGSISGYEVRKGATEVCAATLATHCIDFGPASSGTTVYTVRTIYANGGSHTRSQSVDAPPPGGPASLLGLVGTKNFATTPYCDAAGFDLGRDLVPNFPTSGGTTLTFGSGLNLLACAEAFQAATTMSAGDAVGRFWFTNTGTQACATATANLYQLNPDGSTVLLGGPRAVSPSIPAGTTTPVSRTYTFTLPARTWPAGTKIHWTQATRAGGSSCSGVTLHYGSGAHQSTVSMPAFGGGGGGGLTRPASPTGLGGTANGNGTTTLTWTPPTGTPAADSYRVYRDGQDYTNRVAMVDDPGTPTVTWTDPSTGGTTHVYRVTAVSSALAESTFAGPITR
jgi:hypothetical protein